MPRTPLPRIAITLGDPNGIGIELLLRLLQESTLLKQVQPILYGAHAAFINMINMLDIQKLDYSCVKDESNINPTGIHMIDVAAPDFLPTPGKPSPAGALSAYLALERACRGLQTPAGAQLQALVTLPLAKESFAQTTYAGHTEYLQARFGAAHSLMIMVGKAMRVALFSGHIPLSEVPAQLTEERLHATYTLLFETLIRDFGIPAPRIALLSLNPHAGEQGRIGKTEQKLLQPFVTHKQQLGHAITGPHAADGFFASRAYEKVDAVFALYHDQGLIPFKTICTTDGVNYTAGLPILRTSPAHGTAYTLVGKAVANLGPTRAAIHTVLHLLQKKKIG